MMSSGMSARKGWERCIPWALRLFGDCVHSQLEVLSLLLGLFNIVVAPCAFLPQIATIAWYGNADGISALYILTQLLGSLSNLLGCLLVPITLPTQLYNALALGGATGILLIQILWYRGLFPHPGLVKTIDVESDPAADAKSAAQSLQAEPGIQKSHSASKENETDALTCTGSQNASALTTTLRTSPRTVAAGNTVESPVSGLVLPQADAQPGHWRRGATKMLPIGLLVFLGLGASVFWVLGQLSLTPGHAQAANSGPVHLREAQASAGALPRAMQLVLGTRRALSEPLVGTGAGAAASGEGAGADRAGAGGSGADREGADGAAAGGSAADGAGVGSLAAEVSLADGPTVERLDAEGASGGASLAKGASTEGSDAKGASAEGSVTEGASAEGAVVEGSAAERLQRKPSEEPRSVETMAVVDPERLGSILDPRQQQSSEAAQGVSDPQAQQEHAAGPDPKLSDSGSMGLGLGWIMGWVMAAIYVGGRLPQILLNIRRGTTEGLSVEMVVLQMCGNSSYLLSVLFRSTAPVFLFLNAPWITEVSLNVLLDMMILGQIFLFSPISTPDKSICLISQAASKNKKT